MRKQQSGRQAGTKMVSPGHPKGRQAHTKHTWTPTDPPPPEVAHQHVVRALQQGVCVPLQLAQQRVPYSALGRLGHLG